MPLRPPDAGSFEHLLEAVRIEAKSLSRQLNQGHAVALFERSDVKKSRSRRLAGRALDALCDQFGVVAV